ncbi:MAG TPA: sialate O-acetylesterase [bacterium]|nr:sialate O-acetylesterase [bacterium]HQL62329.1 sialate O-acetylesterase [bacterium]
MSKRKVLYLVVCMAVAASGVYADVKLPSVIGSNMVLQQGKSLPIWGWAASGEQVTVQFAKQKKSAIADSDGHWRVDLKAVKAGGPHTMTISGKNTVTLDNILIGEVWVCSGQSNMQWSVAASDNSKQEIAQANFPGIRLFTAERTVADTPQCNVKGSWVECSPATVGDFSAVGYFFGRNLHKDLGIPIGLINSSWGGTIAEAWTSDATLKADPDYSEILKRGADLIETFKKDFDKYEKDYAAWKEQLKQTVTKGVPLSEMPAPPKNPYRNPNRPSVLYNGMIAPLIPFAVQGAIWYQGESNATRAYQYRKLFSDMIRDWRKNWGSEDFSFLFVQLANFDQAGPANCWAELREAQNMALSLPKTGMAVTIDIGNPKDIHPRNKQEVGRRLALAAEGVTYGRDVVYSGPMYKSMVSEAGKIRVSFDHLDGGLICGDAGELKGFTIAGPDKQFVPAQAKIDGDTVVVWADGVANPVAVRYGWADNPDYCNLYNKAGLPASPFRTDDWPGVTVDAR